MQINRLFGIVYLLLNRKTVTAKELAEHFEVSKRTILRDIDTLSQAGIPIYTTQGKGGGISMLDNCVLDKTAISKEEQEQILFALQSLRSISHMESSSILSKLQALFDNTDTDWIQVDYSRWGSTGADKEKFELLKHAVLKKQMLSFIYASSYGEITDRTVCPLKLVFKSSAWYLQSFCLEKEDYRTFRINRMSSVRPLEDFFDGKALTPPPIDDLEPPANILVNLKLALSSYAAYRVYDEFDSSQIERNADGSFTVTAALPDSDWLYGFLLSFGAAVRVIEPQYVKERLRMQIEKMHSLYL